MPLAARFKKSDISGFGTIAFLSLSLMLSFLFSDAGHAVIIAGLLTIQIILFRDKKLSQAFTYPFLAIVLLMLAGSDNVFDLYTLYPWYDKIVHILAEFILTLLIGKYLTTNYLKTFIKQKLLILIIVFSMGLALGALWEIVEWVMNFYIPPTLLYTTDDIITDLIIDSLGAILAGLVIYRQVSRVPGVSLTGIVQAE